MQPQFARNPTDALQCYADFLDHGHVDRDNPDTAQSVHDMPVYFIATAMGQTLATISCSFPIESDVELTHPEGFLVFERPTLLVNEQNAQWGCSAILWYQSASGTRLSTTIIRPLWWEPPHFYKFSEHDPNECRKWIGALDAFLRRKLAFIAPTRIGKHVARRLKLDRSASECRVIILRQREYKPPLTSRKVDWNWRWLVCGHWRVLPSGPIWITAHMKGPESKPLKPPTSRIFAVMR
jgi:hypothetical protein